MNQKLVSLFDKFVIARSPWGDEAIAQPRCFDPRDCFAEPVLGPRGARTRALAMTGKLM